MAADYMDIL